MSSFVASSFRLTKSHSPLASQTRASRTQSVASHGSSVFSRRRPLDPRLHSTSFQTSGKCHSYWPRSFAVSPRFTLMKSSPRVHPLLTCASSSRACSRQLSLKLTFTVGILLLKKRRERDHREEVKRATKLILWAVRSKSRLVATQTISEPSTAPRDKTLLFQLNRQTRMHLTECKLKPNLKTGARLPSALINLKARSLSALSPICRHTRSKSKQNYRSRLIKCVPKELTASRKSTSKYLAPRCTFSRASKNLWTAVLNSAAAVLCSTCSVPLRAFLSTIREL